MGNAIAGIWQRPLNTSCILDHRVVANAGDVARLIARQLLKDFKHCFGRRPLLKHFSATPILGNKLEDIEIGECLAWRPSDLFEDANSSLGVDKCAVLFTPARGRQPSPFGGHSSKSVDIAATAFAGFQFLGSGCNTPSPPQAKSFPAVQGKILRAG